MPTQPFMSNARLTCDRSSARTSDCSQTSSTATPRDAGEVERAERRDDAERREASDRRRRASRARSRATRAMPKRTGIDRRPSRAIDLEVLARVEHVEAADPRANREAEQPRLPAAASAGREPAAHRRDGHREAEKQLRVGRERAWRANTRTRWRARPATARSTAGRARDAQTTNSDRRDDDERDAPRRATCGRAAARASPCAGCARRSARRRAG